MVHQFQQNEDAQHVFFRRGVKPITPLPSLANFPAPASPFVSLVRAVGAQARAKWVPVQQDIQFDR